MTDPEVTGQSLPASPAAAAPGPPGSAQVPVTGHDPAVPETPPTEAPRRRRRWPVVTLVAVLVVAGLTAGLVVWAPWTPPPVLRPAGLVAGPATANSITFRWVRPATGPLPDKYLVLSDGRVTGSVAGTATSYRRAGLTPASTYQYRVVAVRGGKRSPQSATLAVKTLTPPLSQARLQGPWNVFVKYTRGAHGNRNGTVPWVLTPACAAGVCDVMLHVTQGKYSFTMKLARAGAGYRGRAVVNFYRCGPAGSTIPDPTTLKIEVHATGAVGEGQAWVATSWVGTMKGSYHFVSSAAFYCSASSYATSLTGSPA